MREIHLVRNSGLRLMRHEEASVPEEGCALRETGRRIYMLSAPLSGALEAFVRVGTHLRGNRGRESGKLPRGQDREDKSRIGAKRICLGAKEPGRERKNGNERSKRTTESHGPPE